jgi:hypothetical protein
MRQFNEEAYQESKKTREQEPDGDPWDVKLGAGILSAADLEALDVKERSLLITPWAREGDLGFIFAARGVGKTWLGIHLAHCLAGNKDFGPWKVPSTANRVLYMDGEMSLSDIKFRNHLLGAGRANLFYLNHEWLFEKTQGILNLSNKELQTAIKDFCVARSFGILILDNLSCLVSGVDENSAIEWEKILPWLLQLRRSKITVVFIHHSGREGYLRGHSKREDPAGWIIHLKLPKDDPEHQSQGASFISSFDKYRNAPERPTDLLWNFSPLDNNREMIVRFEEASPYDIFLDLVANGNCQCKIIAQDMDISEASVCRLAKKAEDRGVIEIKGRRYFIKTSTGGGYNPSND